MTMRDVENSLGVIGDAIQLAKGLFGALKSFVRPKTKRWDVSDELKRQIEEDARRWDAERRAGKHVD